ncbi:MAG: hypothetical protein JWO25_3525 [Alphaproteobacteria bacterium]|nr:hypothetical protein [Alphaproteobacteria bacterium]MDB5722063.1 hypothetical protein [Alphaproteobacteria bacterium]
MLKQRRQAAEKVAAHLFAVEEGVDAAISRTAQFTTAMIEARAEANLSAVIGQAELALASRATALMVEARQLIVDAHKQLAQTRIDVGLREVSFGDTSECPPIEGRGSAGLHAVA